MTVTRAYGARQRRASAWLAVLAVAFHIALGAVHSVALAASTHGSSEDTALTAALQALCANWGQTDTDEEGVPEPRNPCAACAHGAAPKDLTVPPALALPFRLTWDEPYAGPPADLRPAHTSPDTIRPLTRAPPVSSI